MVVLLAVRLAVALKEVARAQLLVAVAARKVLGVPGLAQRRNDLAHNRLLARVAAALLRGGDAATGHVRVQVAEHRVQLVAFGEGARLRLRDGRVLDVRHALVRLRVVRHRLHLVAAHSASSSAVLEASVAVVVVVAVGHLVDGGIGWWLLLVEDLGEGID